MGKKWVLNSPSSSSRTSYDGIWDPVFSPDGSHIAYRVELSSGKSAVVLDGVADTDFDDVFANPIFLDNSSIRYTASRGRKEVLVIETKTGK